MTYEQYKNLYPETDALARQVLQNAVNNGCTVVIAAGNNSKGFDGNWISTPAIYSDLFEGVISVASVGNTGNPLITQTMEAKLQSQHLAEISLLAVQLVESSIQIARAVSHGNREQVWLRLSLLALSHSC